MNPGMNYRFKVSAKIVDTLIISKLRAKDIGGQRFDAHGGV